MPQLRRVRVFFYGLFMDAEALRAKGLDPVNVRPARVHGMRLRIGQRAALVESPGDITHGMSMELTHAELDLLYMEPGVTVYRPEAVSLKLDDGSALAALCYNLPTPPNPDERNPEYAAKLRSLAERIGLPSSYVQSLS